MVVFAHWPVVFWMLELFCEMLNGTFRLTPRTHNSSRRVSILLRSSDSKRYPLFILMAPGCSRCTEKTNAGLSMIITSGPLIWIHLQKAKQRSTCDQKEAACRIWHTLPLRALYVTIRTFLTTCVIGNPLPPGSFKDVAVAFATLAPTITLGLVFVCAV